MPTPASIDIPSRPRKSMKAAFAREATVIPSRNLDVLQKWENIEATQKYDQVGTFNRRLQKLPQHINNVEHAKEVLKMLISVVKFEDLDSSICGAWLGQMKDTNVPVVDIDNSTLTSNDLEAIKTQFPQLASLLSQIQTLFLAHIPDVTIRIETLAQIQGKGLSVAKRVLKLKDELNQEHSKVKQLERKTSRHYREKLRSEALITESKQRAQATELMPPSAAAQVVAEQELAREQIATGTKEGSNKITAPSTAEIYAKSNIFRKITASIGVVYEGIGTAADKFFSNADKKIRTVGQVASLYTEYTADKMEGNAQNIVTKVGAKIVGTGLRIGGLVVKDTFIATSAIFTHIPSITAHVADFTAHMGVNLVKNTFLEGIVGGALATISKGVASKHREGVTTRLERVLLEDQPAEVKDQYQALKRRLPNAAAQFLRDLEIENNKVGQAQIEEEIHAKESDRIDFDAGSKYDAMMDAIDRKSAERLKKSKVLQWLDTYLFSGKEFTDAQGNTKEAVGIAKTVLRNFFAESTKRVDANTGAIKHSTRFSPSLARGILGILYFVNSNADKLKARARVDQGGPKCYLTRDEITKKALTLVARYRRDAITRIADPTERKSCTQLYKETFLPGLLANVSGTLASNCNECETLFMSAITDLSSDNDKASRTDRSKLAYSKLETQLQEVGNTIGTATTEYQNFATYIFQLQHEIEQIALAERPGSITEVKKWGRSSGVERGEGMAMFIDGVRRSGLGVVADVLGTRLFSMLAKGAATMATPWAALKGGSAINAIASYTLEKAQEGRNWSGIIELLNNNIEFRSSIFFLLKARKEYVVANHSPFTFLGKEVPQTMLTALDNDDSKSLWNWIEYTIRHQVTNGRGVLQFAEEISSLAYHPQYGTLYRYPSAHSTTVAGGTTGTISNDIRDLTDSDNKGAPLKQVEDMAALMSIVIEKFETGAIAGRQDIWGTRASKSEGQRMLNVMREKLGALEIHSDSNTRSQRFALRAGNEQGAGWQSMSKGVTNGVKAAYTKDWIESVQHIGSRTLFNGWFMQYIDVPAELAAVHGASEFLNWLGSKISPTLGRVLSGAMMDMAHITEMPSHLIQSFFAHPIDTSTTAVSDIAHAIRHPLDTAHAAYEQTADHIRNTLAAPREPEFPTHDYEGTQQVPMSRISSQLARLLPYEENLRPIADNETREQTVAHILKDAYWQGGLYVFDNRSAAAIAHSLELRMQQLWETAEAGSQVRVTVANGHFLLTDENAAHSLTHVPIRIPVEEIINETGLTAHEVRMLTGDTPNASGILPHSLRSTATAQPAAPVAQPAPAPRETPVAQPAAPVAQPAPAPAPAEPATPETPQLDATIMRAFGTVFGMHPHTMDQSDTRRGREGELMDEIDALKGPNNTDVFTRARAGVLAHILETRAAANNIGNSLQGDHLQFGVEGTHFVIRETAAATNAAPREVRIPIEEVVNEMGLTQEEARALTGLSTANAVARHSLRPAATANTNTAPAVRPAPTAQPEPAVPQPRQPASAARPTPAPQAPRAPENRQTAPQQPESPRVAAAEPRIDTARVEPAPRVVQVEYLSPADHLSDADRARLPEETRNRGAAMGVLVEQLQRQFDSNHVDLDIVRAREPDALNVENEVLPGGHATLNIVRDPATGTLWVAGGRFADGSQNNSITNRPLSAVLDYLAHRVQDDGHDEAINTAVSAAQTAVTQERTTHLDRIPANIPAAARTPAPIRETPNDTIVRDAVMDDYLQSFEVSREDRLQANPAQARAVDADDRDSIRGYVNDAELLQSARLHAENGPAANQLAITVANRQVVLTITEDHGVRYASRSDRNANARPELLEQVLADLHHEGRTTATPVVSPAPAPTAPTAPQQTAPRPAPSTTPANTASTGFNGPTFERTVLGALAANDRDFQDQTEDRNHLRVLTAAERNDLVRTLTNNEDIAKEFTFRTITDTDRTTNGTRLGDVIEVSSRNNPDSHIRLVVKEWQGRYYAETIAGDTNSTGTFARHAAIASQPLHMVLSRLANETHLGERPATPASTPAPAAVATGPRPEPTPELTPAQREARNRDFAATVRALPAASHAGIELAPSAQAGTVLIYPSGATDQHRSGLVLRLNTQGNVEPVGLESLQEGNLRGINPASITNVPLATAVEVLSRQARTVPTAASQPPVQTAATPRESIAVSRTDVRTAEVERFMTEADRLPAATLAQIAQDYTRALHTAGQNQLRITVSPTHPDRLLLEYRPTQAGVRPSSIEIAVRAARTQQDNTVADDYEAFIIDRAQGIALGDRNILRSGRLFDRVPAERGSLASVLSTVIGKGFSLTAEGRDTVRNNLVSALDHPTPIAQAAPAGVERTAPDTIAITNRWSTDRFTDANRVNQNTLQSFVAAMNDRGTVVTRSIHMQVQSDGSIRVEDPTNNGYFVRIGVRPSTTDNPATHANDYDAIVLESSGSVWNDIPVNMHGSLAEVLGHIAARDSRATNENVATAVAEVLGNSSTTDRGAAPVPATAPTEMPDRGRGISQEDADSLRGLDGPFSQREPASNEQIDRLMARASGERSASPLVNVVESTITRGAVAQHREQIRTEQSSITILNPADLRADRGAVQNAIWDHQDIVALRVFPNGNDELQFSRPGTTSGIIVRITGEQDGHIMGRITQVRVAGTNIPPTQVDEKIEDIIGRINHGLTNGPSEINFVVPTASNAARQNTERPNLQQTTPPAQPVIPVTPQVTPVTPPEAARPTVSVPETPRPVVEPQVLPAERTARVASPVQNTDAESPTPRAPASFVQGFTPVSIPALDNERVPMVASGVMAERLDRVFNNAPVGNILGHVTGLFAGPHNAVLAMRMMDNGSQEIQTEAAALAEYLNQVTPTDVRLARLRHITADQIEAAVASSLDSGNRISAREIAEKLDIPLDASFFRTDNRAAQSITGMLYNLAGYTAGLRVPADLPEARIVQAIRDAEARLNVHIDDPEAAFRQANGHGPNATRAMYHRIADISDFGTISSPRTADDLDESRMVRIVETGSTATERSLLTLLETVHPISETTDPREVVATLNRLRVAGETYMGSHHEHYPDHHTSAPITIGGTLGATLTDDQVQAIRIGLVRTFVLGRADASHFEETPETPAVTPRATVASATTTPPVALTEQDRQVIAHALARVGDLGPVHGNHPINTLSDLTHEELNTARNRLAADAREKLNRGDLVDAGVLSMIPRMDAELLRQDIIRRSAPALEASLRNQGIIVSAADIERNLLSHLTVGAGGGFVVNTATSGSAHVTGGAGIGVMFSPFELTTTDGRATISIAEFGGALGLSTEGVGVGVGVNLVNVHYRLSNRTTLELGAPIGLDPVSLSVGVGVYAGLQYGISNEWNFAARASAGVSLGATTGPSFGVMIGFERDQRHMYEAARERMINELHMMDPNDPKLSVPYQREFILSHIDMAASELENQDEYVRTIYRQMWESLHTEAARLANPNGFHGAHLVFGVVHNAQGTVIGVGPVFEITVGSHMVFRFTPDNLRQKAQLIHDRNHDLIARLNNNRTHISGGSTIQGEAALRVVRVGSDSEGQFVAINESQPAASASAPRATAAVDTASQMRDTVQRFLSTVAHIRMNNNTLEPTVHNPNTQYRFVSMVPGITVRAENGAVHLDMNNNVQSFNVVRRLVMSGPAITGGEHNNVEVITFVPDKAEGQSDQAYERQFQAQMTEVTNAPREYVALEYTVAGSANVRTVHATTAAPSATEAADTAIPTTTPETRYTTDAELQTLIGQAVNATHTPSDQALLQDVFDHFTHERSQIIGFKNRANEARANHVLADGSFDTVEYFRELNEYVRVEIPHRIGQGRQFSAHMNWAAVTTALMAAANVTDIHDLEARLQRVQVERRLRSVESDPSPLLRDRRDAGQHLTAAIRVGAQRAVAELRAVLPEALRVGPGTTDGIAIAGGRIVRVHATLDERGSGSHRSGFRTTLTSDSDSIRVIGRTEHTMDALPEDQSAFHREMYSRMITDDFVRVKLAPFFESTLTAEDRAHLSNIHLTPEQQRAISLIRHHRLNPEFGTQAQIQAAEATLQTLDANDLTFLNRLSGELDQLAHEVRAETLAGHTDYTYHRAGDNREFSMHMRGIVAVGILAGGTARQASIGNCGNFTEEADIQITRTGSTPVARELTASAANDSIVVGGNSQGTRTAGWNILAGFGGGLMSSESGQPERQPGHPNTPAPQIPTNPGPSGGHTDGPAPQVPTNP